MTTNFKLRNEPACGTLLGALITTGKDETTCDTKWYMKFYLRLASIYRWLEGAREGNTWDFFSFRSNQDCSVNILQCITYVVVKKLK